MSRSSKITILIFVFGVWSLVAAGTIKDFYFEMKAKSSGQIINYSTLSEFCGVVGDRKLGETEFQYGMRRVRAMTTALLAMSLMTVLLFSTVSGIILGIFYLFGAFKEEV